MSRREVRRVPAEWRHPRDQQGRLIPLRAGDFAAALAEWEDGGAVGARPLPEQFMPTWPPAACTHLQLYETNSAGTPLSPPLPSARDLARWLASRVGMVGPGLAATEREWLAMIAAGSAITFSFDAKGEPTSLIELPRAPLRYGRFLRRCIRRLAGDRR